jgi:hypothetical protein
MSSHQAATSGTDVWLTPPDLLAALGPFDLDPCAAPEPRPWPTAAEHYTADVDGLRQEWHGRVWVNPPYSHVEKWLARLAEHGQGTALTFARTDTAAFGRQVWGKATALLFLRGRVNFYTLDGRRGRANAGAPSVLVAYGDDDADVLSDARDHGTIAGALVTGWRS